MTAVLAGGLVVAPVQAPVSSAATTPLEATWTAGLNSALGLASKLFGDTPLGFGLNFAFTLAGPLLTTLLGQSGPSIQDVLDELDDIKNQLQGLQQQITDISDALDQSVVIAQLGECSDQGNLLFKDLTTIQQSTEDYQNYLSALQGVQDKDSAALAQAFQLDFANEALNGTTDVKTAPLEVAIQDIHNLLIPGIANTDGIITTCAKAYFGQWQTAGAAAVSSVPSGTPGMWLDDRQYYTKITALVKYFQSIQAHAMQMLEQAALIKIAADWPARAPKITADNVADICRTAAAYTVTSASLCNSMKKYAAQFHQQIVQEWQIAGVPYSDDNIVMSLGSDVTGVSKGVPSVLWVRSPTAQGGISWGQTPQSWSTKQTAAQFDSISGWSPAGQAEWDALRSSWTASHQNITMPKMAVRQPSSYGDMYDLAGVQPYQPLDLLATMQNTPTIDGTSAFTSTAAGITQVWMPRETGTDDLSKLSAFSSPVTGLQFSQYANILPDWGYEDGEVTYGDVPLTVKCMVLSPDGVLCDSADVGSWWVARMEADYSIDSRDVATGNYTASASYSVNPLNTAAGNFSGSGTDSGCLYRQPCGVGINSAAPLPGWMQGFTPATGPAYPGTDSPAYVWPAAQVPTDAGCTTSWGVPTLCGSAMNAWLAANIPDPDAPVPSSAVPTITAGTGGAVSCSAPQWTPATDKSGASVVPTGQVSWTATVPGSATAYTLQNTVTAGGGGSVSPVSIVTSGGGTSPTAVTLTCGYSAAYQDSLASQGQTTSAATGLTLVDGNWVVDQAAVKIAVKQTDPDPTDGKVSSQVVLTNSGNVPVSVTSLTHQAPGAAPLQVTWPAGTGTLQPGQRAIGTAAIDYAVAHHFQEVGAASAMAAGTTPASAAGTTTTAGPTRPTTAAATPVGVSTRVAPTEPSTVAAGSSPITVAVQAAVIARTPNGRHVVATAAASESVPPPVVKATTVPPAAAAPELAATGLPAGIVAMVGVLLVVLGGAAALIGRRRRLG
jgi:hypothetical protein